MRFSPPADYRRVYQGGHHAVYCNGERHIWTHGGGYASDIIQKLKRQGACDCARYREATDGRHSDPDPRTGDPARA